MCVVMNFNRTRWHTRLKKHRHAGVEFQVRIKTHTQFAASDQCAQDVGVFSQVIAVGLDACHIADNGTNFVNDHQVKSLAAAILLQVIQGFVLNNEAIGPKVLLFVVREFGAVQTQLRRCKRHSRRDDSDTLFLSHVISD